MRSSRAILSVKYTPVAAGAGRAVAGFLRYVQYRDHHELPERQAGVEGLVRYVAYRDSASPQGRLFDREQTVGDRERKELNRYVRRSIANADLQSPRPARAVYRLVLSPEDSRGLDLRALTRATMARLEQQVGGLPPWIAAEHRNTTHPHVHVVLPAFREVSPGRFRHFVISKPRLAEMKQAMSMELNRQRGGRAIEERLPSVQRRGRKDSQVRRRRRNHRPMWHGLGYDFRRVLGRAAASYRRQAEREAELERSRESGWER